MPLSNLKEISKQLHKWYLVNKRELPWRDSSDPYTIWISEIILQQTRVVQGIDYYYRFIKQLPNVKALAEADEDDVLKLWQGLGYYSRARNLHAAAKEIIILHNGIFPTEYDEIKKLKGIGDYTAAAISSFAYNKAYAVVDGNVYRVLSRLFGISTPIDSSKGKKEFAQRAQELIDKKNPGLHNQAIMEFGALFCIPTNPNCENCIFNNACVAFKTESVNILPIKEKKTKQRKRYFNYFYINNNGNTYLQKRTQKDVWQNLYEFPLIETDNEADIIKLLEYPILKDILADSDYSINSKPFKTKHILSHQTIFATFYKMNANHIKDNKLQLIKTKINELDQYAISRLTEIFLESEDFI